LGMIMTRLSAVFPFLPRKLATPTRRVACLRWQQFRDGRSRRTAARHLVSNTRKRPILVYSSIAHLKRSVSMPLQRR